MAVGATGRMRVTVAVVGRRGSASLATSEDARAGYGDMAVPGSLFENRVTARGVVQLASYSPGRMARDLACPVLFCVGDRDGIAPARSTLHYARQAPRAEIMRYRANHFDLHRPPLFERVVGDQIAFLRRHLRQTGDGEAAAGPGAATIRPMAARRA
jgi:pimeloyl-ACP methyl ester carboxylesterase